MSTEPLRSIGIDLGTTNCSIASWNNDTFQLIPNDMGETNTPSYVAFSGDQTLIGTQAKSQCARNPQNTIFDMMSIIGKKLNQ